MFVNTTTQDDAFIKEYVLSWTNRRFLPPYSRVMIIALFIIGCLILRYGIDSSMLNIGFLSLMVAIAVAIITCINLHTIVKMAKERNQLFRPGKDTRQSLRTRVAWSTVMTKSIGSRFRWPPSKTIGRAETISTFCSPEW